MALLFVFSALSGGGKTSLTRALMAKDHSLQRSLSVTTRPQRPGEPDDDYVFLDEAAFDQHLQADDFLEHSHTDQYRYGTLRSTLMAQMALSDVILTLDERGAAHVLKAWPDKTVTVWIEVPKNVLPERLASRGREDDEGLARRLKLIESHEGRPDFYRYCVVNDMWEKALADLGSIIHAERLRVR